MHACAKVAVELLNMIRKTVQRKTKKSWRVSQDHFFWCVQCLHDSTILLSQSGPRRPNGRSSARLTHRFCCRLVQKCVMERMTVPASDEWLFVFLAQRYRIIRRSDGASHIWETRFTDRIREEVNTCREGSCVSLSVWMNLGRNSLDGRWSVLESWKNSGKKILCFGSLFSQNVSVIYNWDMLLIFGEKSMEIQIWARRIVRFLDDYFLCFDLFCFWNNWS